MSDMTFRDRLPDYRNQYNRMKSKAAKGNFLTRLQSAYPISRKLLIKRLSGNRPFKPRKGRGKTFGPEFERLALALHRACGWMCAPYMSALMPRLAKDWEALHGALEPTVRAQLLKAGESTLSRLFRNHPGTHLRQGNRTSGANRTKSALKALPGKKTEDGKPGVFQLDSVAHGGGGPEPFFWSLDMTDAETQWVELAFVWCRGAEPTKDGFWKMAQRLPFHVRKVHPDGGGEFVNHVFLEHLARFMPETEVARSRPGKPNDNCRVEQKNRSILRNWLGERRLDNIELQRDLDWIAENMALYNNLFVPSKRLVAKVPKDAMHRKYRYVYDAPKTPLERLRLADPDNPRLARFEKIMQRTNVISFRALIERKVRDVLRKTRESGFRRQAGSNGTNQDALPASRVANNPNRGAEVLEFMRLQPHGTTPLRQSQATIRHPSSRLPIVSGI